MMEEDTMLRSGSNRVFADGARLAWGTILALALTVPLSGCFLMLGAGAGVGGTVYVMGKLKEDITAPVGKVHEAARAALADLGLKVLEDKGDAMTAHLESEFADGKRVWIDVDKTTDTVSALTIRVGLTGDEARSREILDKIKAHL
jgi:hypothetical protein